MSVQKGGTTEGLDFRGQVQVEFRFVYNEQHQTIAEPSAPDPDFEQLDIVIQLDENAPTFLVRPIFRQRWVTHNGDDIITHDGASTNIVTALSVGYCE